MTLKYFSFINTPQCGSGLNPIKKTKKEPNKRPKYSTLDVIKTTI